MRRAARAEFERKYTAENNYQMLLDLYRRAAANKQKRSQRAEVSGRPAVRALPTPIASYTPSRRVSLPILLESDTFSTGGVA